MIDWTKPIRQKNGRAARCAGTLEHCGQSKRVIEYEMEDGWCINTCTEDGQYLANSPSGRDLENIPQTIVRWVNHYANGVGSFTYDTKEEADKRASHGRIACVRNEFEEGDGLC